MTRLSAGASPSRSLPCSEVRIVSPNFSGLDSQADDEFLTQGPAEAGRTGGSNSAESLISRRVERTTSYRAARSAVPRTIVPTTASSILTGRGCCLDRRAMIEKFSVSEVTTLHASFEEDMQLRVAAGIGGMGIWEAKLPTGLDPSSIASFYQTGLRATLCLPVVTSIFPTPTSPEPSDPTERVNLICASVRRLAPFDPVAVVCQTGDAEGPDSDARNHVVRGLRRIVREAANASHRPITVAIEPSNAAAGGPWSIVHSISESVALIDEVNEPNLGIVLDLWHTGVSSLLLGDIHNSVEHIVGVQLSDRRDPTRSWCDRVRPGAGTLDIRETIEALTASGYRGWYDLEIYSDDGTFGTEFADSLWNRPAVDLLAESKQWFRTIWQSQTLRATDADVGDPDPKL